MLTEFHIGLDDTDSKHGGCTTYTAALIYEKLVEKNIEPTDCPWLVRLNPNIPWKTRGNGALAIHLRTDGERIEEAKQIAVELVQKTSDPSIPGTDPAAVFLQGPIPPALTTFCENALHDVISIREAESLLCSIGAEARTFNGHRGIIGALAALGYGPEKDHTYELIAYRTSQNLGKPRRVDLESVRAMNDRRELRTFNNMDPETRRVLTCPHGPDPVLMGIRGDSPAGLNAAYRQVRIEEPVERVMMFKTNQGTDAHLTRSLTISQLAAHKSVIVAGLVACPPRVIRGGHVIFSLQDATGSVDCAAYQPTGPFRMKTLQLLPGDRVRASGGVRQGPGSRFTINLEKMEVLTLAEVARYVRPRCTACSSSCESMGRGQGFRCRKCGQRFPRNRLERLPLPRDLKEELYIPPPRAHRHLTRPSSRVENATSPGSRDSESGSGQNNLEFYPSQLSTLPEP